MADEIKNAVEMENGAISEAALADIAGGLKLDADAVKKALKYAGVAVVAGGAIAGAAYGGKKLYDDYKEKNKPQPKSFLSGWFGSSDKKKK